MLTGSKLPFRCERLTGVGGLSANLTAGSDGVVLLVTLLIVILVTLRLVSLSLPN